MDTKEIKKLLAGVGIAGLLSGAGLLMTTGTAGARGGGNAGTGGSGCGGAKMGSGMMNTDPAGDGMNSQMQGAADMGKDAATGMDSAAGMDMNATQVQDAATEQAKEKVREKVQEKVQEQVQEALPGK